MRPVERGPWPMDAEGRDKPFAEYGHAKRFLTRRIGEYCSFCERPVTAGLAVEHVRCKHRNPSLEREWSNFLLACPSCNSTKSTKIETAEDEARHLLPHRDRTLDAFDYTAGRVRLAKLDDPDLEQRARNTDKLVGLTRTPHAGLTRAQLLKHSDTRYLERRRAWQKAAAAREDLLEVDEPQMRRRILAEARAVGFWSVWMTVFRDDEQMQAALCEQATFPGTANERIYPLPAHARVG
jgi:hypothetical protein